MKRLFISLLFAFSFCAPCSRLSAQAPNLGVSVSGAIPVGEFAGFDRQQPAIMGETAHDKFGIGPGVSVFILGQVSQNIALRGGVSAFRFSGTSSLPGRVDYHMTCDALALYGDAQYYFDGAHRRLGNYVFGGLGLESNKYSVTDGRLGVSDYDGTNVMRNTLEVGYGHSFYSEGLRWTLEVALHKSLGSNASSDKHLPGTDYIRVSYGIVF